MDSPPHPELMHLQTFTAGASWLHPPPLSLQCLLLGTEAASTASHLSHVSRDTKQRRPLVLEPRTDTQHTEDSDPHAGWQSEASDYCCSLQPAQQLHLEAWRIVGEILRHSGSRQSGQIYGTPPRPPQSPHTPTTSVSVTKYSKKLTNKQTNKTINKGINK